MRKVTPQDIEDEIAFETFFTANDGMIGYAALTGTSKEGLPVQWEEVAAHVTFCLLILRNGTKLIGINYGPVDPADFDPVYAQQLARDEAVRQIWPLLGWRMRDGELFKPQTEENT